VNPHTRLAIYRGPAAFGEGERPAPGRGDARCGPRRAYGAPPPNDADTCPQSASPDGGTCARRYHDQEQVNEVGHARLPAGVAPAAVRAAALTAGRHGVIDGVGANHQKQRQHGERTHPPESGAPPPGTHPLVDSRSLTHLHQDARRARGVHPPRSSGTVTPSGPVMLPEPCRTTPQARRHCVRPGPRYAW
jgi:hypothetical protein